MIGLHVLPVLLYAVTIRNDLSVKRVAFRKRERRVLTNEDASALSRADGSGETTRGTGPSSSSITTMDRFVDFIKRKASPKPSRQPIRSEEPADITPGRRDFQEEADLTPGGEQIPSCITPMKHFFKTKRGESPKPTQKPIRSQEPPEIAAVPPDVPAEVDDTLDGGRNPSYEDVDADRADLTVPQNEGEEMGSQIVVQDTVDGDQELPAPGTSTSAITIGGNGDRNQPASKCS